MTAIFPDVSIARFLPVNAKGIADPPPRADRGQPFRCGRLQNLVHQPDAPVLGQQVFEPEPSRILPFGDTKDGE
jgi:hypothetical protein